ncbi:Outer spore wall assembly protein SHE10 [Meyerozyma sp. JA9]|nr:Outer spore wall assembly protein SHE10 [Meyerozyma sp. JA9]
MARNCISWILVPTLFLTYVTYLLHFACPHPSVFDAKSLNFVDQFACKQLNVVASFVENNPVIQEYDTKLRISKSYGKYVVPNIEKGTKLIQNVDDSYGISAKVSSYLHEPYVIVSGYTYQFSKYVEHVIIPKLSGFYAHYSAQAKGRFGVAFENFKHHFKLLQIRSTAYFGELYRAHVAPRVHSVWYKLSTSTFGQKVRHYYIVLGLDVVFEGVGKLFSSLAERSTSLQEKTHFLKSELKGLIKPLDNLKAKFISREKNVVDVVKEIIQEVEESVTSAKPESESASTEEASAEEAPTETEYDEYDSDSDSEPSTVLITSTITVVSEESGNNEVSENSHQHLLNEELDYWQSKVDKTLQLAYNSLESDFLPQLNEIMEKVKGPISDTLKGVQQNNYEHYKKLNQMISDINKDVSEIQESNELPSEFAVSRQDMRDGISAATEESSQALSSVQQMLADAQKDVIIKYFEAIQNTIDILESFADVTVSEFSNRLTGLLSFMEVEENFDEALGWQAWKQFHKTKEQIFQIRDKIYDEANAYKSKYLEADNTIVPSALKEWDQYFRDIHYHVGFLTHDNEEYLRLVRAKANVAYQAREALERKIEQEREQQEQQHEQEEQEHEQEVQEHEHNDTRRVIVNEYDDEEKIVVVEESKPIIEDSFSDDTVVESDSE